MASILRVMGLGDATDFENYHRVLNRASWSALALSRKWLMVLLKAFVPKGEILIGGDETLERRRGKQIVAKGYLAPKHPRSGCSGPLTRTACAQAKSRRSRKSSGLK